MILVNQGYANTGGTTVMGPVMADTATMGGNGGSIVPSAPPSGFPSTNVTAGDLGRQARIVGADAVGRDRLRDSMIERRLRFQRAQEARASSS